MGQRRDALRSLQCLARVALLPLAALTGGCTESAEQGSVVDAGAPGSGVDACPRGQTRGRDGGCMAVGIQGCADAFTGEDGLCHPSMDRCAAGTLPRFEEGCVAVGIPGCAADFIEDDGVCHPRMAKCPPGAYAVPSLGCVPVDGAAGCGEGAFGDIPDAPGTVYVDPSFADGDGSRDRPLASLAAAMAQVEADGRIALAEGTYRGPVAITKPLNLVGRCPSKVQIEGAPGGGDAPVIALSGVTKAAISGVAIRGAGVAIDAEDVASLRLDRLHIQGASALALQARGRDTRVSMANTWIEGTAQGGGGGLVVDGATATLETIAITGVRSAGVVVIGPGAGVRLIDSLLERIRARGGDGYPAIGAIALDGATLTFERGAVVGISGTGLAAQSTGSSATVTDSLIETSLAVPGFIAESGVGVAAALGADVTVASSVVSGCARTGVIASDGGHATMTGDLIQRNAFGELTSTVGGGGISSNSGQLTLERSALWQNRLMGVLLVDADLDATGTLIEGSIPEETGEEGYGISLDRGGVTLTSTAVVGNQAVGLAAVFAEVTVTESLIAGTLPEESSGYFGRGVELGEGVRATFVSSVVTDNHDVGLICISGDRNPTEMAVTGSLVERTSSRQLDDESGIGITGGWCGVTVASSVLRDNRMAGLLLVQNAVAQVTDTVIDRVPGGVFSLASGERYGEAGDGVLVLKGSTVDLTSLQVTDCARAGILYDESTGVIAGSHVARTRFGLVVQGAQQPTVAADCTFTETSEQPRVSDGDLTVPDIPPAIP